MVRFTAFLAVVSLFALPSYSAMVNISFDDVAPGPLSNQYKDKGVTFKTISYNPAVAPGGITILAPHAGVVNDPVKAVSDDNALFAVVPGEDPPTTITQNAILIEFWVPKGAAGEGQPGLTSMVGISLDMLYATASPQDPMFDFRDDAVDLYALDADGNILAVDGGFDTQVAEVLSITRPQPDIAKAVILFRPAPGSTDTEVYDNLMFESPIPEPVTSLLLVGGAALWIVRRRRTA